MQHTKRTLYQRWAGFLIACYPASWRQRYAEEMLQILEDSPPTLKTILNLFLHLFDAYFHQQLIRERTPHMLQKMRSNELAIYGATLIFFVAWLVVQGHFADPGQPRVLFRSLSASQPLSSNIIHSVSYLLPLFVLFGGLPILLAACWQALKRRKAGSLLLCLLGLISPLVTMIIAIEIFPAWGYVTPFSMVAGLGLSLALIALAVKRVLPSRRITHYALYLATVIPLVMLIGLAVLLSKVIPSLLTLFLTGDVFYVIREDLLILIMLGTLFLVLISLKRGLQARRAGQMACNEGGSHEAMADRMHLPPSQLL